MIAANDGFVCQRCKAENPPAPATSRNHCRVCLYSLHVDATIPGDRESQCRSLMEPLTVGIGKKGQKVITHQCINCKKTITNKSAEDDNSDLLIRLINADPHHAKNT